MSTHPLLYYRTVLSPWGTRLACTAPLSPEAAASPLRPSPFSVPEIQRAAEDSEDSPTALETVCARPPPGAISGLSILAAVPLSCPLCQDSCPFFPLCL